MVSIGSTTSTLLVSSAVSLFFYLIRNSIIWIYIYSCRLFILFGPCLWRIFSFIRVVAIEFYRTLSFRCRFSDHSNSELDTVKL